MPPVMPTIEASHLKRRPAAEKEKVSVQSSHHVCKPEFGSFHKLHIWKMFCCVHCPKIGYSAGFCVKIQFELLIVQSVIWVAFVNFVQIVIFSIMFCEKFSTHFYQVFVKCYIYLH